MAPMIYRLALLVVVVPSLAFAKTVHVSPRPLPDVPRDAQFATVSEAAARVGAGDEVMIHGGVYREWVVVEASGTAERPITFRAAAGERVILTGADPLTDLRREHEKDHAYSAPWPHEFTGWTPNRAHPDDDHHLLIGRSEQVFVGGYALRQVLSRSLLARGTFFADIDDKRLYVWAANNADLSKGEVPVEASARQVIFHAKAKHVRLVGLRFRYAANMAQRGAVVLEGDGCAIEDCSIERTNSIGLSINLADGVAVRRCTFRENGQMGFSADHAHGLVVSDSVIERNNLKGWDRNWEAGGTKIVLSRKVVLERNRFERNKGAGVWFDIGNEECVVRNNLIADNDDAGLFYEISYGLHAHDNVITGNGFEAGKGAWGASAGISISSSPDCRVERNLIVSNKEGLAYREQERKTPRIGGMDGVEVAVSNVGHVVRNNVIAYNRDAQLAGWFDVEDGRHWPPELAKLKLEHGENVYFAAPGQGVVQWGPTWAKHKRYGTLADAQKELPLDVASHWMSPPFADPAARDFRIPGGDGPTAKAYPRGEIPGVTLGVK